MEDITPTCVDREKDIYKLIDDLEKRIKVLESTLLTYRLLAVGIPVDEPVVPWTVTWSTCALL